MFAPTHYIFPPKKSKNSSDLGHFILRSKNVGEKKLCTRDSSLITSTRQPNLPQFKQWKVLRSSTPPTIFSFRETIDVVFESTLLLNIVDTAESASIAPVLQLILTCPHRHHILVCSSCSTNIKVKFKALLIDQSISRQVE